MWQDVTDVVYARKVHDQALEAQAETCVRAAAIAPKVKIVPILPQVHAQLTHAPLEHVETLLSLGTPYNLPDAGHQAVCCGHGPAVVVRAHVEGLDVGGVVTHEGGSLEVLLGKEALVLGLQVDAPAHGILEVGARGLGILEDPDRLAVGDAREIARRHVPQALEQALVHKAVEKGQLVGAGVHHVTDNVLEHRLGHVHVTRKVTEGHLGLDHPELGGVTAGVGVLGAEGGAKGIDVPKGEREVLGLELTRDGEVRGPAKEVLAPVDVPVWGAWGSLDVEGRHTKHLARALGVGGRDDGRVHVDEATLLKEAMYCKGCHTPHAKDGTKEIRAAAQVLLGTEKLAGRPLLLHGVVGRGDPLYVHARGLELEGLGAIGREGELTCDDKRSSDTLGHDALVLRITKPLPADNDLQILEAAAVVEHDETKVLHVSDGADPASNGDRGPSQLVLIRKERGDPRAVHERPSPSRDDGASRRLSAIYGYLS